MKKISFLTSISLVFLALLLFAIGQSIYWKTQANAMAQAVFALEKMPLETLEDFSNFYKAEAAIQEEARALNRRGPLFNLDYFTGNACVAGPDDVPFCSSGGGISLINTLIKEQVANQRLRYNDSYARIRSNPITPNLFREGLRNFPSYPSTVTPVGGTRG